MAEGTIFHPDAFPTCWAHQRSPLPPFSGSTIVPPDSVVSKGWHPSTSQPLNERECGCVRLRRAHRRARATRTKRSPCYKKDLSNQQACPPSPYRPSCILIHVLTWCIEGFKYGDFVVLAHGTLVARRERLPGHRRALVLFRICRVHVHGADSESTRASGREWNEGRLKSYGFAFARTAVLFPPTDYPPCNDSTDVSSSSRDQCVGHLVFDKGGIRLAASVASRCHAVLSNGSPGYTVESGRVRAPGVGREKPHPTQVLRQTNFPCSHFSTILLDFAQRLGLNPNALASLLSCRAAGPSQRAVRRRPSAEVRQQILIQQALQTSQLRS